MTDRLDRIERLLENISTNQAQMQADFQANQQATQTRLDQFDDRMNAASATIADLATRQIVTQNQIDSLTALTLDNRQAIAALLQVSVRHEGRLDDLEGQGEVE
jgi:tetrahydromethanopterin S-methyltransferase subunit G